jgi:two-component system sensor histidine kinase PilS (NtrC family)
MNLEARLKRLMLFRVVMVTTLLSIATYADAVTQDLLAVNPLYFVIVATYVLTVGHTIVLRLSRRLTLQAYVQLVGDVLTITALVYVTGGVRTGFLLLYPLSVLSAAVLVSRRGALSLSALATALYAALLLAVRLGLPAPPGLEDVMAIPPRALGYAVFVLGVACATVALLGAYLAESVRHTGRQLLQAAIEVADLRELNQVIVNSIQSGLLITDVDGRILYLNAFGEGILGLSASSVRGESLQRVLGSPLMGTPALQVRLADRALARLEVAYAGPDGRLLELGVSVTPLATQEASRGQLVVFQDLTEIRRLEQEVRTKEQLAAVGEMTAQLAHEIRNPLGSIRGSAQVLMGGGTIGEDRERLLEIISRESKRLSDTLNRFLYQARPQGRPSSPVDLRPIVESALVLLRNGGDVRADHVIELETDEGPHVCFADPDQIAQVFWNLARNALEAMPQGGRLSVSLVLRGADVVLGVRDEGRGIASEEQRRIFEPFRSSGTAGTGLGLSIVYRIVREHGGDISVRSAPQQGTVVEVRLPRVGAAVAAGGGR